MLVDLKLGFSVLFPLQNGIVWSLGSFEELVSNNGQEYVRTTIHCSILDKNTSKDADSSVALIMASLKEFARANDANSYNPLKIWLKSDNAGGHS